MSRIDLAAKRIERQQARLQAASREGADEWLEIDCGEGRVAVAPPELPLWVLQPFLRVSSDVATLMYQVVNLYQGTETRDDTLTTGLALIAQNASMPQQVIDAITEAAQRLFGDDGFAALVEAKLTLEDVAAVARAMFEHYGVVPGESSPSSDSVESGGPSSKTTSTTEESAPGTSGGGQAPPESPAIPGELVSAAS